MDIDHAEFSDTAKDIAFLPVKAGGLGLRSAVATSHAAWLAVRAVGVRFFSITSSDPEEGVALTASQNETVAAVAAVRAVVGDNAVARGLLPASNQAFSFYSTLTKEKRGKMQKLLTNASMRVKIARIRASLEHDDSKLATRVASIAPKASMWLSAFASRKGLRLADHHFAVAVRNLLGLTPVRLEFLPDRCPCGVDHQVDPWHFMSCKHVSSAARYRRHRLVCEVLASWCRSLGATVRLEPARVAGQSHERFDGEVTIGRRRLFFDASIVHPGAQSYAPKAAGKLLWTAEHAEQRKVRKYAAMAAEEKGEFFPFVIESSGGWGAKATEFVETVIKAAADSHSAWCPHEVVHGIVRLVGVAVQRGNGWMAEGALPQRLRARVDRRLD
jgi:hypothetical protein